MEKIKNVIYKICITGSDKIYIGSAIDFTRRKAKHLQLLEKSKHPNNFLQNSYNKHGGKDCFSMEVLEKVSEKTNLIQREQFYIDSYDFNTLFNLCPFAFSTLGRKASKETIEKIRKNSKNNYYSENLANFREYWKGRKRDEKFSAIVAERNKKRKWTKESRKKLSETQKGKNKKLSEEHKQAIYTSNKGSKRTEETKQKMSQAAKGKPKSGIHKENLSKNHSRKKPVKQIDINSKEIIKIFESITEVRKEFNCSHSAISNCCAKRSYSSHGYLWEYV